MSIQLNKNGSNPVPGPTPGPTPGPAASPVDQFAVQVSKCFSVQLGNDYCDQSQFQFLVASGTQMGLDATSVRSMLEMALEKSGVVNESRLLSELAEMLSRLAGSQRRLRTKDFQDALQYVCKPRPGCRKGLNMSTATQFAIEHCRNTQITMKAGLFSWKIP